MSFPWAVKLGTAAIRLALRLHLPIEPLIRSTLFRVFCGGENVYECQMTIRNLAQFHIGTILDYSLEGAEDEATFSHTLKEILSTLHLSEKNRIEIPFCVFKVTGLARFALLEKLNAGESLTEPEKKEWERAQERIRRIGEEAFRAKVKVLVDAEESWIQGPIDSMAEELMAEFNQNEPLIYTTIQLYRTDRLGYLKELLEKANGKFQVGVKIVRGAYLEKERERAEKLKLPSPIYSSKKEVDEAYDSALRYLIQHLDRVGICAGTHNEPSTLLLTELMKSHGIQPSNTRVYFAQLYGMSDHLSYNLAQKGYRVAKYVPYGPIRVLIPYLFRRAEENTSVQGQTLRELSLLEKERQRRKATR